MFICLHSEFHVFVLLKMDTYLHIIGVYWGITPFDHNLDLTWFTIISYHVIYHFPIISPSFPHNSIYTVYIYILIYVYKCHKIVISHGFRPHVKTGPFPSSSPRDVTSADATCLQGGAQLATARIDFGPSSPDGKKHQKWWFNHGKLWFNRI